MRVRALVSALLIAGPLASEQLVWARDSVRKPKATDYSKERIYVRGPGKCDNARDRQYLSGWGHGGRGINPRYMDGALMNAAGANVLTSLLLAKECGADVDEGTLRRSLKFYYRVVGHGSVPYGDHRPAGGLGSNGKGGMIAAAMRIASESQGDVSRYRKARDYLAMSTIASYPLLASGHGDGGRWRLHPDALQFRPRYGL